MTDPRPGKPELHQTLHGYSHGHRLLAASRQLAAEEERTIALLSDLSGPRMVPSFESYLTGYPLNEGRYYVLARTWYADEMERPGCVWTHSIMIPAQLLKDARYLSPLVSLFRRPTRPASYECYRCEIPLIDSADVATLTSNVREQHAAHLCHELYSNPSCPIVVFSGTPAEVEELVIRVWSQQWGSLRLAFSFCTGALAPRQTSRGALDVQVAPRRNQAIWLREVRRTDVHAFDWSDQWAVKTSPWLRVATQDIYAGSRTELGSFFRETCGDIRGGRQAYVPLVQLHCLLSDQGINEANADELVTSVAESCDDPHDGVQLKRLLLEGWAGSDRTIKGNVPSVLRALVRTPLAGSFDAEAMSLRAHAAAAWPSARDNLGGLISEILARDEEPNPVVRHIIAGCIDAMDTCDLIRLSPTSPGLQYLAVKERPDLAVAEDLWKSESLSESELIAGLGDSEKLRSSTLESVIRTVFLTGRHSVAPLMLRRFGRPGVEAFLNSVSRDVADQPLSITVEWARALSEFRGAVVEWFSSNVQSPKGLEVIAHVVPPHSNELEEISSALVVRSLEQWRKGRRVDTDLRVSSFLLSLGLRRTDPTAAELVAGTFAAVHDAAASGRFTHHAWQNLEDVLPRLHAWREWDTCRKLRLAVAERFVRHDWPTDSFLKLTSDRKTFERLVKAARKVPHGKAWVKELGRGVCSGSLSASREQRRILDEA